MTHQAESLLDEVDVDGYVDDKNIRYIGKAVRLGGTDLYRCLANVAGCLCWVEVRIKKVLPQ